jgi:hypothetical protein
MTIRTAPADALTNAASELSALFPKTSDEPTYSAGFQKWQKLTKKQKTALAALHGYNMSKAIASLNAALN